AHLAAREQTTQAALLAKIREYYDGFCFDGETKVYNPFSTLQLFDQGSFRNYWYESASPWFIARYMKDHGALSTEEFRHTRIGILQIGAQEIERAEPASFLLQSGYLTIEKIDGDMLTLDYPNKEVRTAMSAMFLYHSCGLKTYAALGNDLWKALATGDLDEAKRLFNAALAGIPYDVWNKLPGLNEALFQSYFIMLLEGAGLQVAGEVEAARGRSDVEVRTSARVWIIEFKTAENAQTVDAKSAEAQLQIASRGYADKYAADARQVTSAAFIVDLEKRQVV
ncbi:MAG: PD-(D/E)XK nuclease domain-containing protein, partial [Pyramidobacter sp.]|nr:PD-(D/E)XK nuclease domain-containing protein [Pyramidobacter sp.]